MKCSYLNSNSKTKFMMNFISLNSKYSIHAMIFGLQMFPTIKVYRKFLFSFEFHKILLETTLK